MDSVGEKADNGKRWLDAAKLRFATTRVLFGLIYLRVDLISPSSTCDKCIWRRTGRSVSEPAEQVLMSKILETIQLSRRRKEAVDSGADELAEEIRARLIVGVSKTGGHIGPNLGVVELTLAMHYVFDTPTDSFVFDVSHQAYVHKLLTGREKLFHTIRQPGGLNGFMLRTESEHDSYGAGHAGTALSAALGMAVARDMSGGKEHIVALAGDAAFTNGISFEALNNIAAQTKRLIVVLNDNAWSIDKNVGAIAEYFHKIVTNPTISNLHDKAADLLERFGGKTVAACRAQGRRGGEGVDRAGHVV